MFELPEISSLVEMNREQLKAIRYKVSESITQIKDQLNSAKRKFVTDGVGADLEWMNRAEAALRVHIKYMHEIDQRLAYIKHLNKQKNRKVAEGTAREELNEFRAKLANILGCNQSKNDIIDATLRLKMNSSSVEMNPTDEIKTLARHILRACDRMAIMAMKEK